MTRPRNPARPAPEFPGPREQDAGSAPHRAATPPPGAPGPASEPSPFSAHPEPVEGSHPIRAMAAELDRATAKFGFAVIAIAALWFATGSIGASLPDHNPLIPSEVEGP